MSYINLKSNEIPSQMDISKRTQATIRRFVTQEDELKAARLSRLPSPTQADLDFIARVDRIIAEALVEAQAAQADVDLLIQTIRYEQAKARADEALDPDSLSEEDQTILSQASQEVKDLFDTRNPVNNG